MKIGWAGILVALVAVLLVGVIPPVSLGAETESFSARVEEVDRLYRPYQSTVGAVTRWLIYEPEFRKLTAGGDSLIDESLSYLSEPGHTPLQRRIAILATCKASLSGWVRFSDKILDMYHDHLVDVYEVRDAILPRYIYSHYAMDYFWKPDVRRTLYRMYELQELDTSTKGEIVDTLTGRALFGRWLAGPEPYR